MIEKRTSEREQVSMQLTISSLFRQNNIEVINVEAPIEVINISKNGLGFKTDSILPLDYYFNAKLQFGSDDSSILYAIIKIIRATLPVDENDETTIYGCEIVGLTPVHEEILEKYEAIFNDHEDIDLI